MIMPRTRRNPCVGFGWCGGGEPEDKEALGTHQLRNGRTRTEACSILDPLAHSPRSTQNEAARITPLSSPCPHLPAASHLQTLLRAHSHHSTLNKAARTLPPPLPRLQSELIRTAAPRRRRRNFHRRLRRAYIFPQAQSHWQRKVA